MCQVPAALATFLAVATNTKKPIGWCALLWRCRIWWHREEGAPPFSKEMFASTEKVISSP